MKSFLKVIIVILLTAFTPAFAVESAIYLPKDTPLPERDMNNDGVIDKNDIVIDNTEENFDFFEHFKDPIDHDVSLSSRINKAIHAKVTRTDKANYLLKDILTVDYEKGPIDRLQLYAKYRGNLSTNIFSHDVDTEYDITSIDVGVIGELEKFQETDFKLQLKFAPTKNMTFFQQLISDAYIVNKNIPHHQVYVGNSRNQVGVEGGMSTTFVPFVNRAQIARTFGNTRALGVRVAGKYSLADYSLALNSSDRFFKEFFPGAEVTGWVNFKPLGLLDSEKYGKLVIGGGISKGKRHTDYTVGGAYIGYNYKDFMINAEYSRADGYNGRYTSTNKAEGFYATIGYKITPKIQIVARADHFDPNLNASGDKRREYSAGINYYIIGQGLKLLFNYVFCDNENAEDSHRLILGTQILL